MLTLASGSLTLVASQLAGSELVLTAGQVLGSGLGHPAITSAPFSHVVTVPLTVGLPRLCAWGPRVEESHHTDAV